MTYQEVMYYEKRDSHKAGYQLGRKEGHELGLIEGAIRTHKSLNSTRAQAKSTISEQFSLTEEKADEYIRLYWK